MPGFLFTYWALWVLVLLQGIVVLVVLQQLAKLQELAARRGLSIKGELPLGTIAPEFVLYLGYAGWASGQLEAEIRLGAWSVMSGGSKIIFDPHPNSLWFRLTRDSHTRIASVSNCSGSSCAFSS